MAAALDPSQTIIVPGAYDALSAKLIEEAGFPIAYVGSYATATAAYGLPDVGALTLEELIRHTTSVVDAVNVPVIADAEGGFFDPPNLWRAVRAFERSGAAAIHIEDHAGGKHTTLPQTLIPLDDMLQRLQAAIDARSTGDLAIIARTDAIWATHDLDEAIRRLVAFEDLGVDYLFPTGATPEMLRQIKPFIRTKIVTINRADVADPSAWDGLADVVIDYGYCLRLVSKSLQHGLALARRRLPEAYSPDILENEQAFERRLGYDDFTKRAMKYQMEPGE